MKSIGIIIGALLLTASAHAISIVRPNDLTQAAVFAADTFGPMPDPMHPWTFSVEFGDTFVGQTGTYYGETAGAVSSGHIIVCWNNIGLNTNNVACAFSVDNGGTWRPEYPPVTLRNPLLDEGLIYSSDPGAAACRTARGKTKMLASWVSFGREFLMADDFGEHYNCRADNVFAITGTTDFGVRWDRVHALARGPFLFRDRPTIACDPNSSRCWAMFVGVPPEPDTGYCDDEAAQVYIATSNTCGDTWTAPIPVAPNRHAPANVAVLSNGHMRMGVFTNQYTMNIYDCDPSLHCTILTTGGLDFIAAGSEFGHVKGLPKTRLNSFPTIGCTPSGDRCTVAYMAERGNYQGFIDRASIVYRTSVDNGVTWTSTALIPQLNTYSPDQVMPFVSWGVTKPGLCYYQRQALNLNAGDHEFHFDCITSDDNGLTWLTPAVTLGYPVVVGSKPALGVQEWIGDYSWFDARGGWVAFTNHLSPDVTGSVATKPVIEVVPFRPEGCAIDPQSGNGAWLLIAPFLWLVRRKAAPIMLALLLAGPVHGQTCMGDCDENGEVRIDEVITLINVALEMEPITACPVATHCGDGDLGVYGIYCIVQAVDVALDGCDHAEP